MPKGFKNLVAEAEAQVQTLSPQDLMSLKNDVNAALIDLRDVRELQREGRIAGSVHVPRGMLEFWIDPESPYHKDIFSSGKHFIFYCNKGWRSALAAQTAQQMGLEKVSHLGGGLEAWREAGGNIEDYTKK